MSSRSTNPLYSSIIVTYNSENEIVGLLEDLTAGRNSQPVIVVDNASRDGTVCLIRQNFPQVHLIENKVDTGYARAVNQAFKLSNTEYFFLLNPDIRLPDRTVASTLLRTIRNHPEVAAIAPLQFKDADRKQYLNFTWSYWTPKALVLFLSSLFKLGSPEDKPIPVTYLNAGCLFVRSSAFRRVGMFNEKYFLYGEEPDLFLKFKRAGFTSWLHPGTHIIHHRESSMKSLNNPEYVAIKMKGLVNILNALINGWIGILRDSLSAQ